MSGCLKARSTLGMHYIYETRNTVNGKTYIGQHIPRRFEPAEYLGSGIQITAAIKRYGRESFHKQILLADIASQEEANSWEIYFIARNRKLGKAEYNIADGGRTAGGALSDPSIRKKASETLHRNYITNGPTAGQRRCAEILRTMKRKKGYKQNPDWVARRASSRRTKPGVNWQLHKDSLARISASHHRQVQCIETGRVFESIKAAVAHLGLVNGSGISQCIHGKQHTAAGYHWARVALKELVL